MRLVATVAIATLLLGATAHAQPPALPDLKIDPAKVPPTVLTICAPPLLSSTLAQWRPNVTAALQRVHGAAYGKSRAFQVANAPLSACQALGPHNCFGEPGTVYCNEAVLARVLYSAAALAGLQGLDAVQRARAESSGDTWARMLQAADNADIGPMEVFGLIDAVEEDASIRGVRAPGEPTKLEQRTDVLVRAHGEPARARVKKAMAAADGLRQLDLDPTVTNSWPRDEALTFDVMLHMYRAGADQALAFVVGHELLHAHKGCLASTVAAAASERRVSEFLELQMNEEYFCPNPPRPEEFNADRCGLVTLRAVNEHWQQRERLMATGWQVQPGFQSLGNRLAIDLLGFMIVGGLGTKTHEHYRPETRRGRVDYWPKLQEHDGYLYSALRLLLTADVLRGQSRPPSNAVGACGSTAERVAEGLFRAQIGCVPKPKRSLPEMGVALQRMRLPMALGVADFLISQRSLDTRCNR